MNIYEQGLDKTAANFVALSPTSFVERSAEVFGDLEAVVHGRRRYTWRETRDRAARLAAALRSLGVVRGTTVSAMLHNTPEMVEAHYAVPASTRSSTRSTPASTPRSSPGSSTTASARS
jgi:fatty-acyl-CoA synthase